MTDDARCHFALDRRFPAHHIFTHSSPSTSFSSIMSSTSYTPRSLRPRHISHQCWYASVSFTSVIRSSVESSWFHPRQCTMTDSIFPVCGSVIDFQILYTWYFPSLFGPGCVISCLVIEHCPLCGETAHLRLGGLCPCQWIHVYSLLQIPVPFVRHGRLMLIKLTSAPPFLSSGVYRVAGMAGQVRAYECSDTLLSVPVIICHSFTIM